MAHGTFDSIVPLQTAENSARLLTEAGYSLTWQTYPMAHSVCDREVADIRQFLCSILSI